MRPGTQTTPANWSPTDKAIALATARPLRRWVFAVLLAALLVMDMGIHCYRITRPYSGLHSWGEASGAWAARCHLKYGLGYTRGIRTLAVGEPPDEARRYLSHPQLGALLAAAVMAATEAVSNAAVWTLGGLGVSPFAEMTLPVGLHEWTLRAGLVPINALALLALVLLLRRLMGPAVALLAGLVMTLSPLNAYFGPEAFFLLLMVWALWRYLHIIGRLPWSGRHGLALAELAVALFLMIQLNWTGVFYAFVLFLHVVFEGVRRRQWPRASLLAVVVLAPAAGAILNFLIMWWGFEWDFGKIAALYQWRAASGERAEFSWSAWLAQIVAFARTNFTTPVVIMTAVYLPYALTRHAVQFWRTLRSRASSSAKRPFPAVWFFFLPGFLHLMALKGLVWEHQYWQRSFAPVAAVCAAGVLVGVYQVLARISHHVLAGAVAGALVILIVWRSLLGIDYYFNQHQWQSLRTLALFQQLNARLAPDEALLGWRDFVIKQHEAKAAFYRPEYAWYLDRRIAQARTPQEIFRLAATGDYPVYFIPDTSQPPLLFDGATPEQRRTVQLLRGLSDEQLLARLQQALNTGAPEARLYHWEYEERHRRQLIAILRQYFPYEEFAGDPDDRCMRGNVPCLLFDLRNPLRPPPQIPEMPPPPALR